MMRSHGALLLHAAGPDDALSFAPLAPPPRAPRMGHAWVMRASYA
jgi:hypothetical protein